MSATVLTENFAVRVHPSGLHFNAAHFITFDETCENLHGHNFHVRIDARGQNTKDAFVIDFVKLGEVAAEICAALHDKVLLPGKSREVRLRSEEGLLYVDSYDKHFSFPEANCYILPVANTTAEMLAWYIGNKLLSKLVHADSVAQLSELEVAVEEADQQWGIYRKTIESADKEC